MLSCACTHGPSFVRGGAAGTVPSGCKWGGERASEQVSSAFPRSSLGTAHGTATGTMADRTPPPPTADLPGAAASARRPASAALAVRTADSRGYRYAHRAWRYKSWVFGAVALTYAVASSVPPPPLPLIGPRPRLTQLCPGPPPPLFSRGLQVQRREGSRAQTRCHPRPHRPVLEAVRRRHRRGQVDRLQPQLPPLVQGRRRTGGTPAGHGAL